MYFCAIAPEMADGTSRELRDPSGMDDMAIRRAALITLRRAILERFPTGATAPGVHAMVFRAHHSERLSDVRSRGNWNASVNVASWPHSVGWPFVSDRPSADPPVSRYQTLNIGKADAH